MNEGRKSTKRRHSLQKSFTNEKVVLRGLTSGLRSVQISSAHVTTTIAQQLVRFFWKTIIVRQFLARIDSRKVNRGGREGRRERKAHTQKNMMTSEKRNNGT